VECRRDAAQRWKCASTRAHKERGIGRSGSCGAASGVQFRLLEVDALEHGETHMDAGFAKSRFNKDAEEIADAKENPGSGVERLGMRT
jgi:hypothetical protein